MKHQFINGPSKEKGGKGNRLLCRVQDERNRKGGKKKKTIFNKMVIKDHVKIHS